MRNNESERQNSWHCRMKYAHRRRTCNSYGFSAEGTSLPAWYLTAKNIDIQELVIAETSRNQLFLRHPRPNYCRDIRELVTAEIPKNYLLQRHPVISYCKDIQELVTAETFKN